MNIVVTLNLLASAAIAGILVYFLLKIRAFYHDFLQFVTSQDDKTPSGLAKVVDTIATRVGHSIAIEAKTTLMGKASGQSRLDTAIAGDIAKDSLSSISPLIAGMMSLFPSLGKRIAKNPALADYVVSKMAAGNHAGTPVQEPVNMSKYE